MTRVRQYSEMFALAVGALVYLAAFNQQQPHSDALRIVRQIDAGDLIWNPNHLIFDPLGFVVFRLLSAIFPGMTPLDCFEVISALATILSLLLFHAILVRANIEKTATRILAVLAVFASAAFLSVAVSQYYFMIQMPFLLAALFCYIRALDTGMSPALPPRYVYAIGALLALATAVMFNNLLLVGLTGLSLGLTSGSWRRFHWHTVARFYGAAAAVGVPIFVVGYFLADTDTHFVRWLLSYQGDSDSSLNQIYGLKWTPYHVLMAAAMTGYNLLIDCFVDPAGLGTVLSVVARRQSFEFTPQWGNIVLALLAVPAVIVMLVVTTRFVCRRIRHDPVVRFLTLWIIAFLGFNFLWNVGDDIFWFQIVPPIWLLFLTSQRMATLSCPPSVPLESRTPRLQFRSAALATLSAILLIVNTTNAVAPGAATDFHSKQLDHAAMLREGDLEILPGWDRQKWTILPVNSPNVEQLLLMNLALDSLKSGDSLATLPLIVKSHLASGRRVIVARLFDLDHDLRPWYQLNDMGWSRTRLQGLFKNYCTRRIAVIDGIAFRELTNCDHRPINAEQALPITSSSP